MRSTRRAFCRAGVASGLVLLVALLAASFSSGRAFQSPPAPPRLPRPAQVLPTRTCFTSAFAAPLSLATGCCLTQLAVGDFNGDGHVDLLPNDQDTPFGGSANLRVGDGRGNFGFDRSNGALGGPGTPQSFIATGDFNGDGRPDLALPSGLAGEPLLLRLSAAEGGFTLALNAFPTYTHSNAVAAVSADFNGDGKNDLAVADRTARALTLLAGDGTGRFPATLGAPFKLNADAVLLTAADFNQDGKADLAVADQTANELTLLLSQPAGPHAASAPIKLPNRPVAVVTGDFDRDGRTDLAVANQDITLLINQSNNTFVSQTLVTGGAAGLTAGDFDNDGWLDLAVSFGGRITLWRGAPAGFSSSTTFTAALNSAFITSADFNEDGRPDLALITPSINGSVLILLNTGAGEFNLPPSFMAGDTPRLLDKGDFNRDGIADVVTANLTDEVNVLLGSRSGFSAPLSFKLPPVNEQAFAPFTLLAADLNRDGFSDCAVASARGIYLLLGAAGGALRLLNDTPLPFATRSLQSADFDSDDWPDLAVHDGTNLRVLFNQANTTELGFSAAPSVNVGRPISARFMAGQFDNDARADLIFFDTTGFIGYRVAQGDGAGAFTIRAGASISDGAGAAGALGDFNNDGRLDLATVDFDTSNNDLQVHLGYGYQRGSGGRVLYGVTALLAGNLNNDGQDDLVERSGNELAVILNPATTRFALPLQQGTSRSYSGYAIGGTPGGAALGDFDGDGRGDIAVINQTTNRLVLIRNTTQTNQPPALRAVTQPLNLAQGVIDARLKLADVADADATPGALNAVALGLNISAVLSVEGGALYGRFTVPCDAALGARQFEVLLTDQCLAKAQATLTLNIQPNTPPQLGAYADAVLTSSAAITVKPNALPIDVQTMTVSAAGFTGVLSVNATTGEVRIANAASDGVFTVVVTAADRCGATATQRFTLTVRLPGACGATVPAFNADTLALTHHPTLLATADFDRDGRLDLAATNLPAEPSAEITLLRGTGAGRLEKWKTLRPARFAAGLLTGDFNQDGKPDLAYSYNDANGGVLEILLGDGTGEFAPPRRTVIAQAVFTVISADLNGDGRLDLAAVVDGKQQLALYFGDGDGGFTTMRNVALPIDGARLVSGDFNTDGLPDLAVTTFRASLFVVLGMGGGEFAAPRAQALPFTDFSTSYIIAADFNDDGKLDLAVTGTDASTRNNVTPALLGDGAGGFALRSTNNGAGPLAAADFDRDGRMDLVIVTGTSGAEGVLLFAGAGDGNFCAAKGINPATANTERRVALAVGDFDQDTRPDIAVASEFFWQLTMLLNRTL